MAGVAVFGLIVWISLDPRCTAGSAVCDYAVEQCRGSTGTHLVKPYHYAGDVAQHARDAGSDGGGRMPRRERVRVERRGRVQNLTTAGRRSLPDRGGDVHRGLG